MGEPFIITDPLAGRRQQAARFRRMIESPVLTSVKARFDGLDVYDVEPPQLPDVLGERPVIVFGKWRGDARRPLVIEGQTATARTAESRCDATHARRTPPRCATCGPATASPRCPTRRRWKAATASARRITELGLHYNLLTQYTSFIAVDKVVRNPAPQDARQRQPALAAAQGREQRRAASSAPKCRARPSPTPGRVAVVLSMLAMLLRRPRRHNAAPLHRLKDRNATLTRTRPHTHPRFVRLGHPHRPRAGRSGWRCWPPRWRRPGCGWAARMLRRLGRSARPARAGGAGRAWPGSSRTQLRAAPRLGWLALASAGTLAATLLRTGALPPLAGGRPGRRAGLACGLAAFLPRRMAAAPVLGLAVLALPLLASLQFYAGYPLRVRHGRGQPLAAAAGLQRWRAPAPACWIDGRLVIVDAPCSGVQMVWFGYFTACAVALWARRSDRAFLTRLPAVGAAGARRQRPAQHRAGGARRRGPAARAWAHDAFGPGGAGAVCGAIAWRRRAAAPTGALPSPAVDTPLPGRGRQRSVLERLFANRFVPRRAQGRLRAGHGAVPGGQASACAPAPPRADCPPPRSGRASGTAPPLRPLALSEVEQRFARALSRRHRAHDRRPQTAGAAQVQRAHAHAASGRRLLPRAGLPHRAGAAGARCPGPAVALFRQPSAPARQDCACASASSTPTARAFTDTSAWYWAAASGQSQGPWQAVTVADRVRAVNGHSSKKPLRYLLFRGRWRVRAGPALWSLVCLVVEARRWRPWPPTSGRARVKVGPVQPSRSACRPRCAWPPRPGSRPAGRPLLRHAATAPVQLRLERRPPDAARSAARPAAPVPALGGPAAPADTPAHHGAARRRLLNGRSRRCQRRGPATASAAARTCCARAGTGACRNRRCSCHRRRRRTDRPLVRPAGATTARAERARIDGTLASRGSSVCPPQRLACSRASAVRGRGPGHRGDAGRSQQLRRAVAAGLPTAGWRAP